MDLLTINQPFHGHTAGIPAGRCFQRPRRCCGNALWAGVFSCGIRTRSCARTLAARAARLSSRGWAGAMATSVSSLAHSAPTSPPLTCLRVPSLSLSSCLTPVPNLSASPCACTLPPRVSAYLRYAWRRKFQKRPVHVAKEPYEHLHTCALSLISFA